jgi:alkylation response protein AidB-like acyl-CoA dehydrogenase
MYPGLTQGAIAGARPARVGGAGRRYTFPKLVSGEWSGTMNLTEPHCGTDLA